MSSIDTSSINRNIRGGVKNWEPPWVWFWNLPPGYKIIWVFIICGIITVIVLLSIGVIPVKQHFIVESNNKDENKIL